MRIAVGFASLALCGQTFSTVAISSDVPSPVHSWLMQEGSGNSFFDSVSGDTVTAGGAVSWSAGPGKLATGAHFNGTFDAVATNQAAFNPGTNDAFSVSLWVSFDAISANEEIIISQLTTGSPAGWYLYRYGSGDGKMFGAILQNAGASGYISRGFTTNRQPNFLYHLVLTVDGTATAKGVNLWINGSLTQAWTVNDNLSGSIQPNQPIYFGTWAHTFTWPGGISRLSGFLSSIKIYKRVLTNAEVLALYHAGPASDTMMKATRSTGTVRASVFSALDADCSTGTKIGGGIATDNTDKLQAVLLTASQSNPLDLILDGCSVTTGLNVLQSGYTTIEGTGWTSGLFVLPGSNAAAIRNGWSIYPTSVLGYNVFPSQLPTKGANVTLSNFKIHGNRTGGNAVGSDLRGSDQEWIAGVELSNLTGLTLDTMWVYDAPSYAVLADNVSTVVSSNCRYESPSHAINTDGIHFDGPSDHITITGGYMYTGDDAIALNGPEGYFGTISNVTISGVNIDSRSFNGMREYGTVTGVTVNNCAFPDIANRNSEGLSFLYSAATMDGQACAAPVPPSAGGSAARGSHGFRGATARH